MENVDTGTVFDQSDGTGAANDWVPGIQLPGGLVSSILGDLGMEVLVLLSRLTYYTLRIRGMDWVNRMMSTLTEWLRGVLSTFPSDIFEIFL